MPAAPHRVIAEPAVIDRRRLLGFGVPSAVPLPRSLQPAAGYGRVERIPAAAIPADDADRPLACGRKQFEVIDGRLDTGENAALFEAAFQDVGFLDGLRQFAVVKVRCEDQITPFSEPVCL